ncbi:MAG: MBL fold metallo-hydrolase [Leptolyngbya sp. SIO4C1]|nr:MBL fold metallo-hydrolase [Leptolyngbya sp. SIO4C1]
MELTWFDVNAWQIDIGGRRILVDPWLIGDLVFSGTAWLLRGVRPAPVPIPDQIDLLLLSQGLEDHAHPETLKALDKTIPVVASANGAKVAQALGFESVTALSPGEPAFRFADVLQIQALPGAPIGPFLTENGYLFTVCETGLKVYYEPHGYPPKDLETLGPVDVVITPIVSLGLPGIGPLIRGGEGAFELAKLVKPQLILPTAEGGNITYKGLVSSVLTGSGGVEQLRSQLKSAGLDTRVEPPQPMQHFTLDLQPYAASQT